MVPSVGQIKTSKQSDTVDRIANHSPQLSSSNIIHTNIAVLQRPHCAAANKIIIIVIAVWCWCVVRVCFLPLLQSEQPPQHEHSG